MREGGPISMACMEAAAPRRNTNRATLIGMTPAPPPISLRLGHSGLHALEELARLRGISKAEAARQAIEEAAERESRREGLAAEAQRLSEDPADVQEMREVAKMMEELRGSG
ncbi:MAG TPA: ribbon-helix-helix protein, CopG family [Solirubrobacterales bacterium]|nr:ribbon-helix-helix protein, CopG family [Solirubrobacterales bacterium]